MDNLRIPIVVKLVVGAVFLLLIATVSIAFRSSTVFEQISGPREKDANGTAAEAKAAQIGLLLEKYQDKTRMVASMLLKPYSDQQERVDALNLAFFQDTDLVHVEVIELKDGRKEVVQQITKQDFLKSLNLKEEYFVDLRKIKPFPVSAVFMGEIEIRNSSTSKGAPLITVGLPFVKNDAGQITHVAIADFKIEGIQKPFSRVTERSFYLIDKEGGVLAHPNDKIVLEGKSLVSLAPVKKALASTFAQEELRFFDSELKEYFIATFSKTPFGPAVIAQASEEIILEPARYVRRQAFLITGLVLSGAIFIVFLFSISLTSPIERLVEVTRAVAAGNFDVESGVRTSDEVGDLATSFDHMLGGLRERDKMKNVLNKFHGSTVTEDLMKGDLQLGGVNKSVVVFFSDIRDFTKFSEGHTPEEVVGMLNEYFEIMVAIVTKHHGIVDKFVGDAMMAVWGAPNTTGEDEVWALRACLEMRIALEKLNEIRIGRGQTEIKIGMGLSAGPAISGTIGSSERMEYTVIGDTVNTASRVESSTKSFGTDLLISGPVLEKVESKFVTDFAGAAEVKGKAEPLKMYKVKGFINEAGEPVLVQTKYSDYEAGSDAKVKIAS
jgi:adenylate cyclase